MKLELDEYPSMNLTNISPSEIAIITVAIENYLKAQKDSLIYFKKMLLDEIERQVEKESMDRTRELIEYYESNIPEVTNINDVLKAHWRAP